MIQTIAFYLFATLMLVAGALTVTARNPVHSVLWLIFAFFNAAGLMVLLGAEFVAMLLIVVYVGAVAVLFLFVVMMLDIDFAEMRKNAAKHLPLGIALAVVLLAEMLLVLGAWKTGALAPAARLAPTPDAVPNIQAIGQVLYGRYLFLFEACGLILLVAMIGAIVLTHRPRGDSRAQKVAKQNQRRPQDAVRNVDHPVGQGVEL